MRVLFALLASEGDLTRDRFPISVRFYFFVGEYVIAKKSTCLEAYIIVGPIFGIYKHSINIDN